MKKRLKTDWIAKLNELPAESYSVNIEKWQDLTHVVFLPMYKESIEVLRSTFKNLSAADYPKEKLIIVLAVEERAGGKSQKDAQIIKREFEAFFSHFLIPPKNHEASC